MSIVHSLRNSFQDPEEEEEGGSFEKLSLSPPPSGLRQFGNFFRVTRCSAHQTTNPTVMVCTPKPTRGLKAKIRVCDLS